MHGISKLRRNLKKAQCLNKQYKRTIKSLQGLLWITLLGWLITLASGIYLWKTTERPTPPPIRLMEPDFGWGFNRD